MHTTPVTVGLLGLLVGLLQDYCAAINLCYLCVHDLCHAAAPLSSCVVRTECVAYCHTGIDLCQQSTTCAAVCSSVQQCVQKCVQQCVPNNE